MPTSDSWRQAHARLNAWRDRALDELVQGAGVREPGAVRGAGPRPAQARCARCLSREIDLALIRLDHGRYGLCEDCGAAIAHEHLDIQPAATRCAACQVAWDRAARH